MGNADQVFSSQVAVSTASLLVAQAPLVWLKLLLLLGKLSPPEVFTGSLRKFPEVTGSLRKSPEVTGSGLDRLRSLPNQLSQLCYLLAKMFQLTSRQAVVIEIAGRSRKFMVLGVEDESPIGSACLAATVNVLPGVGKVVFERIIDAAGDGEVLSAYDARPAAVLDLVTIVRNRAVSANELQIVVANLAQSFAKIVRFVRNFVGH